MPSGYVDNRVQCQSPKTNFEEPLDALEPVYAEP